MQVEIIKKVYILNCSDDQLKEVSIDFQIMLLIDWLELRPYGKVLTETINCKHMDKEVEEMSQ